MSSRFLSACILQSLTFLLCRIDFARLVNIGHYFPIQPSPFVSLLLNFHFLTNFMFPLVD